MKLKLSFLMFGLLLAVGWTSSALAQPATYKAADMTDWTYTWEDASGVTQTSNYVHLVTKTDHDGNQYQVYEAEEVSNPYQIYGLLRWVYMDPRFPGPTYSAYKADGTTRERKVYYGGVNNGWNIDGEIAEITSVGDIVITAPNGYVGLKSIYIYNGNSTTPMQSWVGGTGSTVGTVPSSWIFNTNSENSTCRFASNGDGSWYLTYGGSGGGTITIPASSLNGATQVRVVINAALDSGTSGYGLTVNNSTQMLNNTFTDYTWNIGRNNNSSTPIGDVPIVITNHSATFSTYYVYVDSITVYSSSKVITRWDRSMGNTLPSTMTVTSGTRQFNNNYGLYFTGTSGTITIPSSVFNGYESIQIVIHARAQNANYTNGTITVGNYYNNVTSTTPSNFLWNINAELAEFKDDTYQPNEDGYTALVVALKNTPYIAPEPTYFNGSTGYVDKDSVINYIAQNIQFVKLLTDGLRISDAGGNPGTVFNCDGTYNKFFFLGKGKARQKGKEVLDLLVGGGNTWPYYTGECIIFWPLFEEFSPTTAKIVGGSTTIDFFDRMNEGNIYDVVHDCAGVIQNRHEFSLSGEEGTQDYPFTGMNFFIPDFRLKYWQGKDSTTSTSGTVTYIDIDGRDMNAYYDIDGQPFRSLMYYYANFAQYNPDYAPKVGIYKITLNATATPVDNYGPDNRFYTVTLTWVSSLNEMSGEDVQQTYTVYYYDPVTGERKYVIATGITDGKTGLTTVSYEWPQGEHSITIDHIVMGSPDDSDHPSFVAWSNHAKVIIPGWNDFVGLKLDHHESDFEVDDMANWYRNFLAVVNEDIYNGLTVTQISGNENTPGMNNFNLYRYELDENLEFKEGTAKKIANLKFDQLSAEQVHYTVTYDTDNPQEQLKPAGETNKYDLDANHLNVPLQGIVRVKGNGDIVIWPNGYHVNFKSITVKNNGSAINGYTWTSAMNDLPSTMKLSSGSVWQEYNLSTTGDKVGYIEGGGYIYIPNMVGNSSYNNLTVEIVAYGDGANVSTIMVNDESKTIANNTAATYTWGGLDNPLSPNAAPKHNAMLPRYQSKFDNMLNNSGKVEHQSTVNTSGTNINAPVNAPRNADRVIVTNISSLIFTSACGGSGTADDGATWTVTSDATETQYDGTRGIHYGSGTRSVSYLQLSTSSIPGTIKSIVVNASRATGSNSYPAYLNVTVGGAAFGTQQTLGTSNSAYTFQGEASGDITVRLSQTSRARALYCKSIVVTYETETGEEGTADLTVCDGNYFFDYLPVYGYWYDEDQHNQMVYPASMLTDMVGKNITTMTFYPTTGYYDANNNGQYDSGETVYSGLNFSGGSVTFKLMNLSSGTSPYADEDATLITGTMTPVATVTPTANSNATTWVITFDTPFEYTGGDLLIDVTTVAGNFSRTAFTVDVVSENYGLLSLSMNGEHVSVGWNVLPKVTFTYETEGGDTPPQPGVEGGLLRLHLLMVDQLKEQIPDDNSHPDGYGYVLKYEPEEEGIEPKQSGTVKVEIQKTDCEVTGYYSLKQIDNDTEIGINHDQGITMDVVTADVAFDLSNDNSLLDSYILEGKASFEPDYYGMTKLQQTQNFTYVEMLEGSPNKGQEYPNGEHHYLDELKLGTYGSTFVDYGPSVSTWGIERRYYEDDGLDNTYGGPIWKTAVGQVRMSTDEAPIAERQINQWNSVNWDDQGGPASLYILDNIVATAKLPHTEIATVKYEPYMFRVFVESKNGLLRPYTVVPAGDGPYDGEHLAAKDGELTEADMKGPKCVWSGYLNFDEDGEVIGDLPNGVEVTIGSEDGQKTYTYIKNKVDRPDGYDDEGNPLGPWNQDEMNALFGALDALAIDGYNEQGKPIYHQITNDDLNVFVRFYYVVKGMADGWVPGSRGQGDDPAGYGTESPGSTPSPWTSVKEILYHGEIVSQTYYNVQGMMSDKPFDGVNIVVTRFSDGATVVSKEVR